MPWHKKDWSAVSNENGARDALSGLPAGQYSIPHFEDMAECNSPEIQQKYKDGPSRIHHHQTGRCTPT